MENFRIYTYRTVEKLIATREGETKFGQKVLFTENLVQLSNLPARYVLFGIPEDIGVRANRGRAGTAKAWQVTLRSLLNIQSNNYTGPGNLILLGEVNCDEAMKMASNIGEDDPNYFAKLGDLVKTIDEVVTKVVQKIVAAGKIPIIIGGGHNNAYGNIKGSSLALNKPLNIINIDAHTDLRTTDHRHSGNGFSFAGQENYLGKYRMFGIHQNYTPAYIFNRIEASHNFQYRLFEHLMLKSSAQILEAFEEELAVIAVDDFGLELDVDAIKDFPSSAQTPSGFNFNMIRKFIHKASGEENLKYLHICEAAPTRATEQQVGKAMAYLITDFIKQE